MFARDFTGLNVVPEDATELIVRKGRVILSDSHTKVKGGNKVVFSATNVSVAKLTKEEKKNKDEVETWSKNRAETLAKANRKITIGCSTPRLRRIAIPSRPRRAFGLWFFNAHLGCYTFLPLLLRFGFALWLVLHHGDLLRAVGAALMEIRAGTIPQGNGAAGGNGGQSAPSSGGGGYSGGGRPAPPASSGGNGGFGA